MLRYSDVEHDQHPRAEDSDSGGWEHLDDDDLWHDAEDSETMFDSSTLSRQEDGLSLNPADESLVVQQHKKTKRRRSKIGKLLGWMFKSLKRSKRKGSLLFGKDVQEALEHCNLVPFECICCFESFDVGQGLDLGCEHLTCFDCMKNYCLTRMDERGNCNAMTCMSCASLIPDVDLKVLLGENRFHTFDRRRMEQFIAMTPDFHLCPSPDCTFIYEKPMENLSVEDMLVNCPQCSENHCAQCKAYPFHVGYSCEEYAKDNSTLHSLLKKAKIRICPGCGHGIQKRSGCNKMQCRCGYKMCFNCGTKDATCGCTPKYHGFIDNAEHTTYSSSDDDGY